MPIFFKTRSPVRRETERTRHVIGFDRPIAIVQVAAVSFVLDVLWQISRRKGVEMSLSKDSAAIRTALAHIEAWTREGGIVMARALGDPPHGGLFVFDADESAIDEFVRADPYVQADLVTAHRVEPWTVVAERT